MAVIVALAGFFLWPLFYGLQTPLTLTFSDLVIVFGVVGVPLGTVAGALAYVVNRYIRKIEDENKHHRTVWLAAVENNTDTVEKLAEVVHGHGGYFDGILSAIVDIAAQSDIGFTEEELQTLRRKAGRRNDR